MFSLIIPTYNSEKRIVDFLNNIYPQLSVEDEIICINDGSQDNTLNILNEYSANKPNVRIFSIENSGAGCARNVGIDNASQEYLWFVDDDDFIPEGSLAKIKEEIALTNPELFVFNVLEIRKGNRKKYWKFTDIDIYYDDVSYVPNLFLKQQWVWNKILKKTFIIDNEIYFDKEYRYFEDIYFFMKVYPLIKGIYFSTGIYYHYLKNDFSATSSLSNFKTYPNALWHEYKTFLKYKKNNKKEY